MGVCWEAKHLWEPRMEPQLLGVMLVEAGAVRN